VNFVDKARDKAPDKDMTDSRQMSRRSDLTRMLPSTASEGRNQTGLATKCAKREQRYSAGAFVSFVLFCG